MANDHSAHSHGSHHIVPVSVCVKTAAVLLVFTAITVVVAQFDFGSLNLLVALVVATFKALLVALFFMNLRHDDKMNGMIFATSFLFLMIFIALTAFDWFYRGDVAVKKGEPIFKASGGPAKFARAWIATPEIVGHGKGLFTAQCVSCHGEKGDGNGPAAAALNPRPRNFTVDAGWKTGRKPSQIFTTLTKGLGGMPAFGSLPAEDRWALAHYVRTFAAGAPSDTDADLKAAGVDPSKADSASSGPKEIPIDFAIQREAK